MRETVATRARRLPLIGLPPADWPRFWPIALAFALSQAVALVVYLGATTLFLKQCGAKYLPWTFLAGYLLALALSALFRRLKGASAFGLLAGYYATYSIFLVASGLNGASGSFASYFLILAVVVPFPILNWMLFWNSLEGTLVIQEVKLWTPLVTAGAFLTQVLTGLATGALTRLVGLPGLFMLGIAGLALSAGCLWRVSGAGERAGGAGPAKEAPRPQPAEAGQQETAMLSSIARLVFGFSFFKYLVDYQLNQAVASHHESAAEVASFLGRFDSLTKATIFLLQTGLTGRLLSVTPPGRVLAAMPVVLGLACAAVLGGAGYAAILAANLIFTVFDKGINRSCLNLLLAPLPPDRARQARLRLDGQVFGSGVIAVSVAMIVLPALLAPKVCFAVLLALCAVYLACCVRIDEYYVGALQMNLAGGSQTLREQALGRLRAFSEQRRAESLRLMLQSPDPERRLQAASEVAATGHPAAAAALEAALAREEDARVQATLVIQWARVGAHPAVFESYAGSLDFRVRSNAMEAAAIPASHGAADPLAAAMALGMLRRGLEDPHPRVRACAAAGICRATLDRQEMATALAGLQRMLENDDGKTRAAACWALGQVSHPALVPALTVRLTDPEGNARRQAVLALDRMFAPAALPALRQALKDPASKGISPEISRAIRRLEDRTRTEVLWALGGLERSERQALSSNLARLGEQEGGLLARVLRIEDSGYRTRLGKALEQTRSPAARDALAKAVGLGPDGAVLVSVGPLVQALKEPEAPLELWALLSRLRSRRNAGELFEAAHAFVRELAEALLVSAPGTALPRRPVLRAARLLGAAAGDRSVTAALLALGGARDRRRAGLSVELLEKRLPDGPLRRDVVALVEASPDDSALREVARRVAGGCISSAA